MRTLFGENILSPSPNPSSSDKPSSSFDNPFNHPFPNTANSTAASSSAASSSGGGSYRENEWLTRQIQTEERQKEERRDREARHSSSKDAAIRYGQVRRKGNPNMLFMGMRRSGKSSIQKVIFEKFSPAETLYLEPTTKVEHATMDSFMKFESAELPYNLPYMDPSFDHSSIFASAGAIIWVLDMQDEYFHSITKLIETAIFLLETYPRINFEVFIHKTDGLSEEYKYDTFRDVRQRVQDELSDNGYGDRGVAFYQTSIFDHSIYEAMSKVVQKLIPQLPAMETLLNKLCSTCRIQKAYLFDTISKIYLATDASPTFLKDYEACSDYVDVIVDIKQIYGWQTRGQDGVLVGDGSSESGAVGESLISHDKSGNTYIYAREINDYLSLICVMGQGSTPNKRVIIDYNVSILADAVIAMFKL